MIFYFKKYQIEIASFLSTFFIAFVLFNLTSMRFPNDDQFILYRYVDNIVSGNGFVFNVGEKVLGSTTPLFTIVSSLFSYIFKSVYIPDIVAYLNIFLLSISSVFVFKIAKRLSVNDVYSYVLVLIYSLNMSKMIPEGMETPMFLVFTLSAVYCLLTEKRKLSAVLLSLSLITRPDSILIAFLFLIFWYLNFKIKETIRLVSISILVALPWLIFAVFYFGSFIPQSLLAKMHSSDIVRMPEYQAFKVQLASISRIYWGSVIDYQRIILQVILNLIPVLVMIFLFIKNVINRNNWIVLGIPVIYFIAFSLSNPIMFPWYVSQIEPFWLIVSFVGLYSFITKLNIKYIHLLLLFLLVFPIISFTKRVTSDDVGSKTALFLSADYLSKHLKDNQTVGISNIGIVSFETKAKIVDFFGLVRPDSVLYYPIKNGCFKKDELYVIPPDLIKDSRPDFLVAGDGEMDPCFKKSSWFKNNYKENFRIGSLGIYSLTK